MDGLMAGIDAEKDAMIRQWMEAIRASWEDRQDWVREMTERIADQSHRLDIYVYAWENPSE
jgi:hypothetical protein